MRASVVVVVLAFLVAQPTGARSRSEALFVSGTHTATSAAPATARIAQAIPSPPITASAATSLVPDLATAATIASTTTIQQRLVAPRYSVGAEPVSLTFDDGPNDVYTPQILEILGRYGVHATFFVVGAEVDRLPDLTRRIVAEGHVLGNHTWDHVDLTTLDESGFRAQIDRTEDLLTTFTGRRGPCVRPPFGRVNQTVRDAVRSRGLTMRRWSTDTDDWKRPGTDEIVRRALAGARPGAVILMHDSGPDMSQTVAALPRVIETMRQRGLRFAATCG